MLEIIECRTYREMARFFRAGDLFGYRSAEKRYLQRFVNRALNPIAANGPMCFLLARENGRAAGRILTFCDMRYIERTGRKEGFFALPDARDARVAHALLERAERMQKKWGNDILTGPVSPDGSGFFGGVTRGTDRDIFEGIASECVWDALSSRGYEARSRFDAYTVCVPKTNPFSALAARAEKRFRLEPVSFSGFGAREKHEKWIAECAPKERRADVLREFERINSVLSRRHSFAVLSGGKCVGYMLTLRSKESGLRAATLETRPGAYTPPIALLLLSALCDSLIRDGVKTVTASVIDRRNRASSRLAIRAGGSVKCTYYEFFLKSINKLTEK